MAKAKQSAQPNQAVEPTIMGTASNAFISLLRAVNSSALAINKGAEATYHVMASANALSEAGHLRAEEIKIGSIDACKQRASAAGITFDVDEILAIS